MRLVLLSLILALLGTARLGYAQQAQHLTAPDPDSETPYSEVVIAGDIIYLSGQLGIVPGTGKLAEGGIVPEARQAMENLKAALKRAGGSMSEVVKCTVFLADIDDYAAMNRVFSAYFPARPARSTVGVSGLPRGARIEVECTALAP